LLFAAAGLASSTAFAATQAQVCSQLLPLRDPSVFEQWRASHKNYDAQQASSFEQWTLEIQAQHEQLRAEDLWGAVDWSVAQGRIASGLTLAADRVLRAAAFVSAPAAKIDERYESVRNFGAALQNGDTSADALAFRFLFEQTPVGNEVLSALDLASAIAALQSDDRTRLRARVETQMERLRQQYQYAYQGALQHRTLFAGHDALKEAIDSTCGAAKRPKPPTGLTVQ
jgi:hypothetical protein